MAENISRIGVNTGAINNTYQNQTKKNETEVKEEVKNQQSTNDKPQVSANDVLSFMANQAISVNPKAVSKTYDVSKYVSPEQAERIAGFMASFENHVTKGLEQINQMEELSGLSDKAKYEIAANMVG